MKKKVSKKIKLWRVFRRKLLKPIGIACLISFMIYLIVGNIIFYKKLNDYDKPHFVISRITNKFDEIEYMHLLLCIQEIGKNKKLNDELIGFVNGGFPNPCPRDLKDELYKMNWEAQAFLIRVKKLFLMYKTYERILRIDETIEFLNEENKRLKFAEETILLQIENLNNEKDLLLKKSILPSEYEFIKEYHGIVLKLKY